MDFSFASEVHGSQALNFPLVRENDGGVRRVRGVQEGTAMQNVAVKSK